MITLIFFFISLFLPKADYCDLVPLFWCVIEPVSLRIESFCGIGYIGEINWISVMSFTKSVLLGIFLVGLNLLCWCHLSHRHGFPKLAILVAFDSCSSNIIRLDKILRIFHLIQRKIWISIAKSPHGAYLYAYHLSRLLWIWNALMELCFHKWTLDLVSFLILAH